MTRSHRTGAGLFRPLALALPTLFVLAVLAAAPAEAQLPLADPDRTGPRLVGLLALLAFLLGGFFLMRPRMPDVLRAVVFWGGMAVVLVALYAVRADLEAVGRETLAALVPGLAVQSAGGSVVVNRVSGGHFSLRGAVNGAPVRFLFDTGASTVVLTHGDAARAGLDPAALSYSLPVMTANGLTRVAPVFLDEVSVGDIVMEDVRAAVARPEALTVSLLGNSFLNRLAGYQVSRNRLVLEP